MEPETQIQKLFRLWRSPLVNTEIAHELDISVSKLYELAKKHKLPPRRKMPRNVDNENPSAKDPSPEEILARAAEVQAKWDEKERLRRYRGKRRVSYIAPRYEYNSRNGLFTGLDD